MWYQDFFTLLFRITIKKYKINVLLTTQWGTYLSKWQLSKIPYRFNSLLAQSDLFCKIRLRSMFWIEKVKTRNVWVPSCLITTIEEARQSISQSVVSWQTALASNWPIESQRKINWKADWNSYIQQFGYALYFNFDLQCRLWFTDKSNM